jgi:uncharacterized protein YeaO (DUF488 family)
MPFTSKWLNNMIKLFRTYDAIKNPPDNYSILIDRLWSRGIKKSSLIVDEWIKEIAPSNDLRKWFNHDPEKWKEFKKKYKAELKGNKDLIRRIKMCEKYHHTINLLYGAKDEVHNHAVVLKEVLDRFVI